MAPGTVAPPVAPGTVAPGTIKNIPNEMLYGINYKQYYPSVNYEFDENFHKKNYH